MNSSPDLPRTQTNVIARLAEDAASGRPEFKVLYEDRIPIQLPLCRDTLLSIGGDYAVAVDINEYIEHQGTGLPITVIDWRWQRSFIYLVHIPIESLPLVRPST
jgi:hypothetical protein